MRELFLALGLATGVLAGPAEADRLPALEGPVILTISGDDTTVEFDLAMLRSLPQVTIETGTDWTDGVGQFAGPLARDVLEAAGADGEIVLARALNDYEVEIPTADFEAYDVILALQLDGTPLSRRDKGPIWVVYPRDQHVDLQSAEYNARWIWQLRHVVVE